MINTNPITVLIVDDSEVDRYTYRHYLELASPRYQVHEAANRLEGICLPKTVNPDCILLDLAFPNDFGIEILEELVASPDQLKLPVIILSALSFKSLEEGALQFENVGTSSRATPPGKSWINSSER